MTSMEGGCGFPDVEDVVGGSAAGVAAGGAWVEGVAEGYVDVHGQWVFGFAGGGYVVDEGRDGPGVEELVGVFAEDLMPGAGGFAEGGQELRGDLAGDELVGSGGEVADAAVGAGLVLDLDHENGVLRVFGLEGVHEGGEGGGVGFESDLGVWREGVDFAAVFADDVGNVGLVELDEGRGCSGRWRSSRCRTIGGRDGDDARGRR